jgi:mannosyltransferase
MGTVQTDLADATPEVRRPPSTPATPTARPPRRVVPARLVPALVPGLLMAVAGLLGATRPVLSWDEVATVDVAGRDLPRIWHLAHAIDGVFAPYYLLIHGWTAVAGDSVLALRLPSVLAMAVAVALTGELGRRLFSPATGLAAGLMLVALPTTSRYAAEVRPYAIACLFSVSALLALTRVLDRPRAAGWAVYGVAVLGAGLSHLVTVSALGGHLAIVLLRRRRHLVPWAGTVAITLVLLGPVIWLGVRQRGTQLAWVPPVTAGGVFTFPARLVGSIPAAWLLIGLLLVAFWRPVRPLAAMFLAAAVPLAVVAAVSLTGSSFWVIRYVLFILMPAALVAAAGLAHGFAGLGHRARWLRLAVVLGTLFAAGLPAQLAVRGPTAKNGSDYRTVAAVIRRDQQPGDAIVYEAGSRTLRAGIDYYLRDDPGRPRDALLTRSAAEMGGLRARESTDPVARVDGAERVWLLVFGRRDSPATARRDLTSFFRTECQRVAVWHVKNATLALFTRKT